MENETIIHKLLKEKYVSLASREKDFVVKHFVSGFTENPDSKHSQLLAGNLTASLNESRMNFSSTLYGCIGGFIIHRIFSKESKNEFNIVIQEKPIEDFIKEITVKEKSGVILNLYRLLESSVGMKLSLRQAIDIGSQGEGIKVSGFFEIDGFQLIIAKDDDIAEVIDDMKDIIGLDIKLKNIEKDNLDLKRTVQSLMNIKNPIIISEGKTDWKHFIKALEYFHKKNEFKSINKEWFLKFGSRYDQENLICGTNFILENSVTELNKILQSFIDSSKFDNNTEQPIRIGIFDSDDPNAKNINNKESQVFSILIEPNNISTELLYSEKEIKTSIEGKRLFLGEEFDRKTKRHISNKNLNIGGDNNTLNKAGLRKIIDNYVYNENGENIAISKDLFAQKIYLNEIQISGESWENFRHIFEKLYDILQLANKN